MRARIKNLSDFSVWEKSSITGSKIALTRLNSGCEKLEIIVFKLFIFQRLQQRFHDQAIRRDGNINIFFCVVAVFL